VSNVKIPVHNLRGDTVDEIELDDSVFDVPFREGVVHQCVTRLLANKRQGTAATKTRGEVSGSTRKLYAQKGTGRARRGSIKSPLVRGGGIVFGPSPRSYRQRMPKKMRRLAFACALSMKARDGALWAIEDFDFAAPRTKDVAALVGGVGRAKSVLIVVPEPQPVLALSARNLQGATVRPCSVMSTLDVMSHDKLIVTVPALRKMEQIWGTKGSGDESA
jgi:large subunit ribosomal protein L4